MKNRHHPTLEGVKRLSDALIESTTWFDGNPHLSPDQEEALAWAKKFMDDYERKYKLGKFGE